MIPQILDFPGATLGPAFFDVHFHGAAGRDVMEATPEALDTICQFLGSRGTGSFLATTVTAPLDATLKSVSGLAKIIANDPVPGQARPIGIHLEGPFLSHAKRGVQPAAYLLAPDIKTFDRLCEAAEGNVRLMTLAPELPGASELAAHATARGVRVSLGHSNATASETHAAIEAGAVSATHTFNAMRALDHREPGILGVVLTDRFALCGDHLRRHPQRTADGQALVVRQGPGTRHSGDRRDECRWNARRRVQTGRIRGSGEGWGAMADGVLAGSVLTLDRALTNFVRFTGARAELGLRLMTTNPAAMTGLSEQAASGNIGSVRVGQRANLVAVDTHGKLVGAVIGGEQIAVG